MHIGFLVCPYLWQFGHWAMSLLCLGGSNFILHCHKTNRKHYTSIVGVGTGYRLDD
jgi:hypothetical protein